MPNTCGEYIGCLVVFLLIGTVHNMLSIFVSLVSMHAHACRVCRVGVLIDGIIHNPRFRRKEYKPICWHSPHQKEHVCFGFCEPVTLFPTWISLIRSNLPFSFSNHRRLVILPMARMSPFDATNITGIV